ncbi:hypothetical protein Pelo_1274 [Pelomyxa schiedti]|nr:hypothetical protein Pelo_1274 [Pelomyxa schiedti]
MRRSETGQHVLFVEIINSSTVVTTVLELVEGSAEFITVLHLYDGGLSANLGLQQHIRPTEDHGSQAWDIPTCDCRSSLVGAIINLPFNPGSGFSIVGFHN